jgi:gamma-glutamylcyclotransferase (GGCT)/AIG2-like uncharacterized protein YtfP
MYYFSYGVVAEQYQSNAMLSRGIVVVAAHAWVKGELYDTGLAFPAMTAGKDTIEGMLFEIDELATQTIIGMAKSFDKLNPPFIFELKPIVVQTKTVTYEGHAFTYEHAQGLTKIS